MFGNILFTMGDMEQDVELEVEVVLYMTLRSWRRNCVDAVIVPPADLQVEVLLTDGCLRVAKYLCFSIFRLCKTRTITENLNNHGGESFFLIFFLMMFGR